MKDHFGKRLLSVSISTTKDPEKDGHKPHLKFPFFKF
jgi:hypothetical protein